MSADDIQAFLTAQLDADEQKALNATGGRSGVWTYIETPGGNRKVVDDLGYSVSEHYVGKDVEPYSVIEDQGRAVTGTPDVDASPWLTGPHIATHDPARVLRQVAAMQRRLERHQPRGEFCTLSDFEVDVGPWPCWEIRNDLLTFADRPGFDPRWVREEGL